MASLNAGDKIGDWIVVEALGQGGMGSVYRCHSTLTEQVQSAIKLLAHKGKASKTRFVREVEVLSSLQHQSIVRVLGGGQHGENGTLYLVMELVDGQDLDYFIRSQKLQWPEACRIVRDCARGLAAAHAKGVHHRDIKPANLMVDGDGNVKIIDFGIALQDGQTRLTRQQAVPGTMAYMPPEVFGQQSFDADLGDIYSLGMCLFETLRGHYAYPEDDGLTSAQRFAAIMVRKLKDLDLDPGDSFSDALREVTKRATAKDPARRYASADAFADALEALLVGEEVPEWVAPTAGSLAPKKDSDDTFTLDTALMPDEPAVPRERYRKKVPKKKAAGPWFPFLSLGYSVIAAAGPPAWFGFFCLVAIPIPELGGLVVALTMIIMPLVLPLIALSGMFATTWFMVRVPRNDLTVVFWWFVGLTLFAVHCGAIAVALADTALLVSIWEEVARPTQDWLPQLPGLST